MGAAPPIELVGRALALAEAADRADLHRRLTGVRERVLDPAVRVLVVGEPRQGKSSLVNALVSAPVCVVGREQETGVPVVVRHGGTAAAALVYATAPADGPVPTGGGAATRVPVPVGSLALELARATGATGATADGRQLVGAEVELPRRLLEGGLQLVDTAGVGGIGSAAALRTVDLLPGATAVLVVSDASQEYTAPELAFLRQAAALCPHVVAVLTKTDTSPQWRTIAEIDRGHLAAAGLDVPVFPVSSTLELLAVQRKDRDLHEESGMAALTAHLRREVLDRAGTLARRSTVHDLTSVTDQLALSLRTELSGLQDPARNDALLAELETARTRVDDLRRQSSRWQQVLADGVTDLMADIDHDLRDRARVVTREADEAIDAHDPGPLWDDLTEWLDQRIGGAVADSYVWASQRSEWLATEVVEQFARDGGGPLPDLPIGDGREVLGSLVRVEDIDRGAMTVPQRVLIGMKGSYSGVLMTGLVTSMVGLGLVNPISLAAGLALGGKAYRDDKLTRRQRRQAEAKAAVRRHLDEVVFQVGKQLKDRLRQVQRTLRDLVTDTVDEMSRTLTDALRGAQQSVKVAAAERDARVREVRRQLALVERLAADVAQLTPRTTA
jgi:predicted GTPase